jgi:hypothetical protein
MSVSQPITPRLSSWPSRRPCWRRSLHAPASITWRDHIITSAWCNTLRCLGTSWMSCSTMQLWDQWPPIYQRVLHSQVSCRKEKDVKQTFVVFQSQFATVRYPALIWFEDNCGRWLIRVWSCRTWSSRVESERQRLQRIPIWSLRVSWSSYRYWSPGAHGFWWIFRHACINRWLRYSWTTVKWSHRASVEAQWTTSTVPTAWSSWTLDYLICCTPSVSKNTCWSLIDLDIF